MSSFPAYEFYVALGLISGIAVLYFKNKKTNPPFFKSIFELCSLSLLGVLCAFWGARSLGELVQAYSQQGLDWNLLNVLILDKASGPVVYYGGLLALLYYFYWIGRYKKYSFYKILDFCVPAILFAHAIGRIGCWARGCCHGSHCPYFWGITRSTSLFPIHPVQLYEAFGLFILFYLSTRDRSVFKKLPSNSALFLTFYPLLRFFLEFVRGDETRAFVGPLSTSQWISIPLLIWGLVLVSKDKRRA